MVKIIGYTLRKVKVEASGLKFYFFKYKPQKPKVARVRVQRVVKPTTRKKEWDIGELHSLKGGEENGE